MKVSISSYSFHALTNDGKMSWADCIKWAKEAGADGFEIAGLGRDWDSDPLGYAQALKDECDKVGLEITNYTVGGDFLNGTGGSPDNEAERLMGQVDIAHAIGAPGMRHDLTSGFSYGQRKYRGFDNILAQLAEGCRTVADYAAGKGIRTMVENHGFFSQDSDRLEKLVNAVAHENFGILCDMGNFLCVDEDPVQAVSRLAPYTFLAHAKDFHVKSGSAPSPGKGFFGTRGGNYLRGAIIGHGDVPVKQCLRILRNAGYNGYVSIEFEGMEDPLKGIAIGLENLRHYIGAL